MSIFVDFVNLFGPENLQGIIAVVVAGLMGKTSWDSYKSKETPTKAEINSHIEKLKKEIDEQLEDARSQLKEIKESSLKQVKEEVKEIGEKTIKRMEKFESKFNEMNEKSELISTKLSTFIDESGKPKISRADIRRMKDRE
jgi:DNA anti-recombination protein RmuC